MSQQSCIDFVIPWVDGNNTQWQARYAQYAGERGDSRNIRFRDWDLLRYWFRAIERFTPWVRRIYFITSGELPEWLNLDHSKLHWLKHEEYIPAEYLPTFSVNTIEMNLHRIEGLSEQFVYFNDDMFVIQPLKASIFFRNKLPCSSAVMSAKPSGGSIVHMVMNDIEVLNRHFDKHRVIKKRPLKWFNLKYGKGLLNNILLYPWNDFSGFVEPHIPNAFLKSTLQTIWEKEPELLDATCRRKFRTNEDVNQWLIRYWQLAEGCFHPVDNIRNTLCIDITGSNMPSICNAITQQKQAMLC
ncbi:MAG: Stealth CR1 domain-containing protein, partial [Prevotella sp.]|nr:Stealth CR1 domain-containing protein [Prevotella sp.]